MKTLLLCVALALGWTEDRGEPLAGDEGVGVDVEQQLGPPPGPPRSGAALEQATEHASLLLRCPVCQGLTIADSPSESARNMKSQVRAMLAAGYTEQQILDYFVEAYGEFVLTMPEPKGFNLFVFVVPAAGAALLLLLGWQTVRRRPVAPIPKEETLDPWLAKVRQELEQDP